MTLVERLRTNLGGFAAALEAAAEIERLRAALLSLAEDPPATLDEPDPDWEVIIKMRNIAREAVGARLE